MSAGPGVLTAGGLRRGRRQFAGGAQEEAAVLGGAFAVEAEHGEFVTGEVAVTGGAIQQIGNGGGECGGDAADIAAQLAGAVGFPLRDRASADLAEGGELILGEAPGLAELADAAADGVRD